MPGTSTTRHYEGRKYEKISAGRREGILALLGDFSHKRILDIGCANGVLGETLKKISPCEVTGIDISAQAVAEARGKIDHAYVCNLEDEDGWPEELLGKHVDIIILSEVLEHLFSPEKLLKRVHALALDGADVIVSVPNILFWKNRLRILAGHFEYTDRGLMDRGHIRFFSWKSFMEMVENEHFAIEGVAHHAPTRGTRLLSQYFPGLFAHNFIVKLRKHD